MGVLYEGQNSIVYTERYDHAVFSQVNVYWRIREVLGTVGDPIYIRKHTILHAYPKRLSNTLLTLGSLRLQTRKIWDFMFPDGDPQEFEEATAAFLDADEIR